MVVPNRIEAVVDRRVLDRRSRGNDGRPIQRMSPVTRADRDVEVGGGASPGDRRDIGCVIEAACVCHGVRGVVMSPEGGDRTAGDEVGGGAAIRDVETPQDRKSVV